MLGRKKGRSGFGTWKKNLPTRIASSYVPHPTKTMWERHQAAYKLPKRDMNKPLLTAEQSIEEVETTGRTFTNEELRVHFGFTRKMIQRFRHEQTVREKWIEKEKADETKTKKKRKMGEESLAREKEIIAMRLEEPTPSLGEMGAKFGVTRERIRQILAKAEKKYGITLPHRGGHKKEPWIPVIRHCLVCHKPRELLKEPRVEWTTNFCNEHYMRPEGYQYYKEYGVAWWSMTKNERFAWILKHIPVRLQKFKESQKKYYLSIKNDPVKYQEYKKKSKMYTDRYVANRKRKNLPKTRPFIEVPDHDDQEWLKEQAKKLL